MAVVPCLKNRDGIIVHYDTSNWLTGGLVPGFTCIVFVEHYLTYHLL